MLILTRRIGETIMIGDDVAITVLGIQGGQVRIGVDAPLEIKVHRQEIYLRIQQENGGHQENNGHNEAVDHPADAPASPRTHEPVITVRPRTRLGTSGVG